MARQLDIGGPEVKHGVIVYADPEQVWELISDPRRAPKWNPLVQQVDMHEKSEPGLGATARWTSSFAGVTITGSHEITNWDPPRRVEVQCRESRTGIRLRGEFSLEPSDEGTELVGVLGIGLPNLFQPLLSNFMSEALERALSNVSEVFAKSRQA